MKHFKRLGALFALFTAAAGTVVAGGAVTAMAVDNTGKVADPVQRGAVTVYKYDAEQEKNQPMGGGDLEGVEFTITNESDNAVVYYDEYGHSLLKNKGESWTIQVKYQNVIGTNGTKAYVAQTPLRALPVGKYHIQETGGSAGYGLATQDVFINHKYVPGYITAQQKKWVDDGYWFVIDRDGQIVTFNGNDGGVEGATGNGTSASPYKSSVTDLAQKGDYTIKLGAYNPVIRGGIEVAKRDHDLLRASSQGGASLEGGTFVIYNSNTYPVRVWDHFDQDDQGVFHGVVAENYTVNLRSNTSVTVPTWEGTQATTKTFSGKVTTEFQDSVTYNGRTYDGGGWVLPGGIVAAVQTGDDGRAQTFMDALPVGWYTVVEVEAPIGYVREKLWESHVEITNDDWDALVVTDCDDPVLRGGLEVVKRDSSYLMKDAEPQGDTKLAGAKIGFFAINGKDVVIREPNANGGTGDTSDFFKNPDARLGGTRVSAANIGVVTNKKTGAPVISAADVANLRANADVAHGLVGIAVTNDQGIAQLKQLPYGQYVAIELEPSDGYELNEDWSIVLNVADSERGMCDEIGNNIVAGTDTTVKQGDDPRESNMLLQDPTRPDRNRIEIQKLDAETGKDKSLVDGKTFKNVKFKVVNSSDHAIVWYPVKNGAVEYLTDEYGDRLSLNELQNDPRAVRYDSGKEIGTFTVNPETGSVVLFNLPKGRYTVTEAQAPEGYIRNTESKVVYVGYTNVPDDAFDGSTSFSNQVVREDLQFQKVNADTQKPLAGVGFLLEKLDDEGNVMERHVLVSDEDGMVDTSGDASGYQSWRARFKDGQPHYNLADKYYDEATGEFTYVPPVADKEAVLAELNGDGTEENPGLLKELEDLIAQLDDILTKANIEGIKTLYDELVQIVREANEIALDEDQGVDSRAYANKIKEEADKIVEIHEAIAAARAAAGDDYLAQIDTLEEQIRLKEEEIKDAQDRLAKIDDELTGDAAIWETGYWFFGGEQDAQVKPNETLGALPYGNYRLTELRCEANKGLKLVTRDIVIKRGHNLVENIGTINNDPYNDCDPCNDRSIQGLEVDMHKTSNPAPNSQVKAGQTITYTLNYENTSAEDVPFLQIRDYIPNSTTFKSAANDGKFVEGENYVEWVIPDVKVGDKGSVSFAVTVDRGADPIIINQAHYGISKTEIVAGSGLDDPYGSTNVVKHTTDGTKTGAYLEAVKTSSPAAGTMVKVGDKITYTVEVKNIGDETAANVGVADIIPDYTKLAVKNDETTEYYDVNAISNDGYLVTDNMIGWDLGSIKAGESKTVSFTVEVQDTARKFVRNQASFGITRGKVTGSLDNTTNIVEHEVETLPEITITKSANKGDVVSAGEVITYTLHIENNGRGNAYQVPVYDIIPEHTQYIIDSASSNIQFDQNHTYPEATGTDASDETPYVSWTIPVLFNRGGSVDVSYKVRVKDNTKVGDLIQNRGTVGGNGPQPVTTAEPTVTNLENDGFAVSNLIEHRVIDPLQDPDFHIEKTADPADGSYIAAGDEITYTITWKNDTDNPIYGFAVRDSIPEHTTFKEGSIVVTGADGKTSTEVKAEAEQTTTDTDECGTINEATSESIVWTPVVAFGDGNASDPENIFRAITGGDINEETHHVYGWRTIKTAIANLKVGEYTEFEVKVDDDYDQLWRATLLSDGRLALLMQILVPNQDGSPNFARANGIIANYDQKWKDVYALQYELLPGQGGSLTFTVIVDEDVEDNTVIKNHATYESGVFAPPCFDLKYETNETEHIVGSPSLTGTKEVSPAEYAQAGDTLHYKVTITNEGTARAKNVAIHDQFRDDEALKGVAYVPGSWKVSGADAAKASADLAFGYTTTTTTVGARATELQPGDSIVMEFDVKLVDVVAGDVITNIASYQDQFDGDPTMVELKNKTNKTEVTVDEAKLSIDKTVDVKNGTKVEVGDTLTYTIKVTNDSHVAMTGAAVYDAIPAYTTYVGQTGGLKPVHGEPVAELDENGNPVIDEETGEPVMVEGPVVAVAADNISLPAGGSKTFTLKVTIDPILVDDVTISNRATAGFATNPTMPLPFDSKEVINEAIAPDSALRVIASADPVTGSNVKPGDVITYTVDVLNESRTPAKDTAVFIQIPEHVTFVNGSATGGLALTETGLFGGGKALVATGLNLGDHESTTFTFQVKVDDTLEDAIVSLRATVGESRSVPTSALDIDSNEVIHNVAAPKPALSVTQDSTPAMGNKLSVGDIVTYTIKVSETNGVPANGVAVFDAIPAGTTYVDGSADGLTEIKSGKIVTGLYADGISLAANGTAEFSFQVKVNATDVDREITNQATAGFASKPTLPLEIAATPIDHEVVAVKPALSIVHSSTPAAGTKLAVGDTITYTFKVTETNGASTDNAAVFDAIPENTTYVAGSAQGLNEIKDGGKVVALAADGIHLDANGSAEFSFRVTVNAVENDVEISNMPTCGFADVADQPLQISANKIDHEVIVVKPALAITHTSDPESGTSLKSGDEVTYTIVVSEVNGVTATGVAVFDAIPAHTTFVSGSATGGLKTIEKDGQIVAVAADNITIAGGASKTFSFKVVVDDVADDIEITNNPTTGFATDPQLPLEISATNIDHNIIAPKPGLSVTKAAEPASGTKVAAGDVITYTVEVHETNGVKAEGVAAFDYIPEGTTYVAGSATGGFKEIKNSAGTVTALAADGIKLSKKGTATLTFQVTVDETAEDIEIANRATAGFATAPKLPLGIASNTVTHNVTAPKAALRITKSASNNGAPVAAGDVIDYSFTVLNESAAVARGVAVYDAVPVGTEYVAGSATGGLKEIKDANGVVTALYADGLTIAGNRSRTFGFSVTVNLDNEAGSLVSNRATCGFADGPTAPLEVASNEVTKPVTVEEPEISISHSSDPAAGTKVAAGDTITYTVKVSETNGVAAKNVAVFDEIPEGATYVSATGALEPVTVDGKVVAVAATGIELAPKGTAIMTFTVKVDETEADKAISNTPTCGISETAEANLPISAKTIDHVVVAPTPRLVVTKTSDPKPGARIGNEELITYTITVKNDSVAKATGVAVFDKIPANTTFVDGSATGGLNAFEQSGKVVAVRADGISIDAGATKTFTFQVKTDKFLENGTIISNRATAGFATDPTSELDVHSNETVSRSMAPNTTLVQTSDPVNGSTVVEGDVLTFTINVKNDSDANDYDVVIFDKIPAGTSYVDGSATAEGADVEVKNGAVAVHFDKIDAGAEIPVTFKVVVLQSAGDKIENVATYGYDQNVPTSALENETNAISFDVDHVPHLTIVKSQEPADGAWVAGGDDLVYHITVKNVGRAVAHNVGIYDEAPENTEYVVGSLETSRGSVYVGEDGLLTNIAGDLASGQSVTMSFKVTIDLGFEGIIRNTAMWVSPAADPRSIDVASNAASGSPDVVAPEGAILGVLGASVPIPDGSYSGVSNEVSAGGGSETPDEPSQPDTPDTPDTPDNPVNPEGSDSNEVIAVVEAPSVRIIKTSDPADGRIVKQGSKITYTLDISNVGTSNANSLYIFDKFHEAMTLVDGSLKATGIGAVVENGGIVMRGSLKPGESAQVSFQVKLDDEFSGDIINVAEWGQAKPGETPEKFTSRSNETIAHVGNTNVELIKSADIIDGDYISRGKTMKYTITAKNHGKHALDLVINDELPKGISVIEDSLPAGVKLVDGHIVFEAGMVDPDGETSFSFDVIVDDDASGDIVNKATWSAKNADDSNESNSITVHVGEPHINGAKTSVPGGTDPVGPGETVQYSIVLSNDGTAEGIVRVSDKLPEGLTLDSESVKAIVITEADFEALFNDLPDAADEAADVDSADDEITENDAADSVAGISVDTDGTDITIDIEPTDFFGKLGRTFTNFVDWITGKASEGAGITVKDNGLFGALEIQPGEFVIITYNAKTADDLEDGTELVNTAVVELDGHDPQPYENKVIVGKPVLSMLKTAEPASGSEVNTGDVITYRMSVANTGTVAGHGVAAYDAVPEGTTYVDGSARILADDGADMAVAEDDIVIRDADGNVTGVSYLFEDIAAQATSMTLEFQVTVNSDMTGKIENVGQFKDGQTARPEGPIDGEDSNVVEHEATGAPVITVKKTSDPEAGSKVSAGARIEYFVTIANSGTRFGDVDFADELPAGLKLDAASVHAEAYKIADDVDTTDEAAPAADAPADADADAADAASDDVDAFDGVDDVDAEGVDTVDALGDDVDIVDDDGIVDGDNDLFPTDDTVPADSLDVNDGEGNIIDNIADAVKGTEYDITVDGNKLSGKFRVEAGYKVVISYVANVADDAEAGAELTNKAIVKVGDSDPIESENTLHVGEPHLVMSKTADKNKAAAGDTITYDMFVTNDGDAAATGVLLHDAIPAGTTYVEGSERLVKDGKTIATSEDFQTFDKDGNPVTEANSNIREISCYVGTVPAGESSAHLVFEVTVNRDAAGKKIKNIGHWSVNVDPDDPQPSDKPGDSDPVVVPVDDETPAKTPAKLGIKKVGVDGNGKTTTSFKAGTTQTWNITVTNTGEEDATNVRVVDTFGENLTFESATIDGANVVPTISGQSSSTTADNNALAAAQKAAKNSAGAYEVGIAKLGHEYGLGTGYDSSTTEASPIPAGTFTVTAKDGYQATFSITECDSNGKAMSNTTKIYNLGYSSSNANETVVVPDNARISIKLFSKNSSGVATQVTSTVPTGLVFTPAGAVKEATASTTSASKTDYTASFIIPKVAGGKSVTIVVKTKVAANAPSKIVNTGSVYSFANDSKPSASSVATLNRSDYSETPKKGDDTTKKTETMPKTAVGLGALALVGAGLFFTVGGGREIIKNRKRDDDIVA